MIHPFPSTAQSFQSHLCFSNPILYICSHSMSHCPTSLTNVTFINVNEVVNSPQLTSLLYSNGCHYGSVGLIHIWCWWMAWCCWGGLLMMGSDGRGFWRRVIHPPPFPSFPTPQPKSHPVPTHIHIPRPHRNNFNPIPSRLECNSPIFLSKKSKGLNSYVLFFCPYPTPQELAVVASQTPN